MSQADSAGVPWAGRTPAGPPFPDDAGGTSPELAAALAGGSLVAVAAAWAAGRVLVPVRAVLGEGTAAVATAGDRRADMALALLTDPDGRRALPAFSGAAALARWDPVARPVPVEAARAAQAAVAEGCTAVVVDPGGPHGRVLPRPVVWAVAQGREWVPPVNDPDVLSAVAAAVAGVPEVAGHACRDDGAAGLEIVLSLPAGLPADRVGELAAAVARALGDVPVVAERVAAVRLTLRAA